MIKFIKYEPSSLVVVVLRDKQYYYYYYRLLWGARLCWYTCVINMLDIGFGMYLGIAIGVDRYWLFDVYCWDKDSQSACI